ncbi:Protein CBG27772 [Caenorhabditis briggsae]|uniref:Protein CBG27772 n=1 Tax=Caenorhabditis briggsae TaxID=6238 RepID=B6II09_CAEBR|nr:Protein CBG27772 [Caenorhabditis briggsae]CAR99539.1 Protein CBG27772 [Caenorhabditis briggsae]
MNRTAENMTDAITYLSLVVDHVNSNKTVSHTAKQISKQAGCAVAGTVVGGVLAGPIGAAVGSVVGAGIGLSVSDKYDGVLQKLLKLSEDEQFNLVQEVGETASIRKTSLQFRSEILLAKIRSSRSTYGTRSRVTKLPSKHCLSLQSDLLQLQHNPLQ